MYDTTSQKSTCGESLKELVLLSGKSVELICSELNLVPSMFYSWWSDHKLPCVKNAVRLADYFECSLDYLVDLRTRDKNPKIGQAIKPFNEILPQIMKEFGKNPSTLSKDLHVSRSSIYDWLTGRFEPSLASLISMSIKLDCSLEHLVGRE